MNVTVTELVPPHATEAPARPDHLAGAVLRSLGRSFDGKFAWSSARTFVLGLVSFGLWPLLSWTASLRDYIRLEQQQLWHLAEWMRLQTGHPDAPKLRDAANAVRWRGGLATCALLWAALPLLIILPHLHDVGWGQWVMDGTYGFRRTHAEGTAGEEAVVLFGLWTLGLSLAYAFHWMQVQFHAADVRRFVDRFNTIAAWEGVAPLTPRPIGIGVGVGSVLGGFVMFAAGAAWGVPMLLAGTAQRRYIGLTSGPLRAQAGEAVRTILSLRRPVMRVGSFLTPTRLCREARCRNALSPLAKFCPRCGTRAGVVMSEVA